MRLRLLALVALAVLALAAAGCGKDDDDSSSGSSALGTETEQPAQTETEAAGDKAEDKVDTSVKPVIDKPSGSPPKELVVEDVVKGKGKAAKAGDTVSVQYVGVSFSNGEQFDASWDRGQPFSFQLGTGGVIAGWDKGLVGMKAGGRRKLTIPPEMGYGAQGTPDGSIAPNETLVFVVDLESIN